MWLIKEILKEYDIEVTEPPSHINYDISIILFKELKKGKKLEELVKEILERIKDYVLNYEIKGGYLNINLNWNAILKKWQDLFNFQTRKEKIIVEHTSVNPNKALHIGHLRNAILGDSIVRLLRLAGYNVEVLNYIDDTGSQIADVIVGLYYLGFSEEPKEFDIKKVLEKIKEFLISENLYNEGIEKEIEKIILKRMETLKKLYGYEIPEKFDHYCGDFIYVIVNKLYELIPELEKYRKIVIKKIEEGNNEIHYFTMKISKKVLKKQLETLWKFDIYYDLLNKESDILHFKLWDKTFELLKIKNIIIYVTEGEKKGTWCIDLSKWEEFSDLEDKLKVLVRSDGTTVYLAKDIAYAFWKHGLIDVDFKYSIFTTQPNGKEIWQTDINGINIEGFGKSDISINVIGGEQTYLQKIISKIINEIDPNKKYIHYSYGLVMLSKNTAKIFGIETEKEILRMSGRKGIYINADNLLEKTIDIAKEKIKERNKDLDDNTINNLAFKIARSTIAFEILKYDKNTVVVFDLDKMTNIEEGNVLYLMYTYARINSLLKKASIKNPEEYIDNLIELNEYERKLLRKIFLFKDIIENTVRSLEINNIAKYALDLALIFNEFYQNVPVIPELDKKPYRIFLVYLTKKIFEKLFYILKIDEVERI